MATRFEYYITGDDSNVACYGTNWMGQTFTPSVTHTLTNVKLLLARVLEPGEVTVSISPTTAGKPDYDSDLCVGTTNGNTLTEDTDVGEWRGITLGDGAEVTSDVMYAIVIRAADGDDSNSLRARADISSPAYTRGAFVVGTSSGGIWAIQYDKDLMFEEWSGPPTGTTPTVTTQANTDIAPESLTGNGVVTDLGGSTVTQHGHCWSTSQNPTIADTKTLKGIAYQTGHFTSAITPLTPGVTYYFKAYATNSYGTSYGSQVSNTMATAIGRRHWWVEGRDFHWFGQDGVEYIAPGIGVASPDIPWPF